MLTTDDCKFKNCTQPAWTGADFCQDHHPDKEGFTQTVRETIVNTAGTLEGRYWYKMDLSDLNLSGKEFRHCCFSGSCFNRVDFSSSQFFMCMIDNLEAADCRLTSVRMLSSLAAGSNFSRSDFTGSDLVNVNFNGISGLASIFNESDLYCSRFIRANLTAAQFCGCNLARVDLLDSILENAVFTDSNPRDAYILPGDE